MAQPYGHRTEQKPANTGVPVHRPDQYRGAAAPTWIPQGQTAGTWVSSPVAGDSRLSNGESEWRWQAPPEEAKVPPPPVAGDMLADNVDPAVASRMRRARFLTQGRSGTNTGGGLLGSPGMSFAGKQLLGS